MENAKRSGSQKKLPIQERLEAFARAHPGEQYLIWTEVEAAELLMALSMSIKANERAISKPIELAGDSLDAHRRSYNNTQLRLVRQMANKMKRQAANGAALPFCMEEMSHTPLEFSGIEIVFPADQEELAKAAAAAAERELEQQVH